MATDWTTEDQEKALAEGWGVFDLDGNPANTQIQRHDELEIFASDSAAIRYVLAATRNGNPLTAKALLVCTTDYYDASRTVVFTIDGGVGDDHWSPEGITVVKVDYDDNPEAEIDIEDGIIAITLGEEETEPHQHG